MTSDSKGSSPVQSRKRSISHSPEKYKKHKEEHKSQKKSKRSRRSSEDGYNSRDKKSRKYSEKSREYTRYYGEDQKKRNSDRYWNKYSDENTIGKRYYENEGEKKKVGNKEEREESMPKPREKKPIDFLTTKTGGAYIPPAKLRLMQAEITDKNSVAFQRLAWEALKKSIHGFINKVNTSNLAIIAKELLHENIIRGRGLLCKSIIQAQAASPTFTNVYSALVAIINSKFPNIGELLLKRLVLQFKRGFRQNNKVNCISAATFIAHLVNQSIAHEILALEILTLLVETPTDDSVEVAISFLKECGQKLTEVSSKGINAIFEMLRNILHEGQLEKRIQYMIEVMFQIRKDGFKDHAAVIEELDLVDEEDQFTHLITLDDVNPENSEDILNVFKFDDKYEENEGKYKLLTKEILDESGSESGSGSEDDESNNDEEEEENEEEKKEVIIDNTDTNLITLRRTIYLTMQSSLDFEECTHKLLKMNLKPGQEIELCHMILDCCAEQRTYEKFFGLVAQRFCQINNVYIEPFQQIFKDTYATTHRLDANRLRNVSKFFAHLLFTDAIGWEVLEIMKLNEEDTNSSSRIFIKILFQELAEYMGLGKLNTRLKDGDLQPFFTGLFPRDLPKNTRFSINFFTSIGLGGLTDELREHLKNLPKTPLIVMPEQSESSSSSSSSDSSSEETSDSSSDSEDKKSKKKKKKDKSKKQKESSDESMKDEKYSRKAKGKSSKRESFDRHKERQKEKDYEWIKSRYQDNVSQLKERKEYFDKQKDKQSKSGRNKESNKKSHSNSDSNRRRH